jgi:phosphoserine phosphatase
MEIASGQTNKVDQPQMVPLCVDLDGTLLNTDTLWECLKQMVLTKPILALLLPFWFLKGRACLKQEIARHANLNVAALPFHRGFREFLKHEKERGTKLILATASDQSLATKIAAHIGMFDEVLASDGRRNLRGREKAALLVQRFGERGFDYAGNSRMDLQVWARARRAIIVNGSETLTRKARTLSEVSRVFREEPGNPCRTPW